MKICLVIGVLKLTSLSSGWPRLDLCGDARILILQFPALVPSTLLAWDPHSSPESYSASHRLTPQDRTLSA
ncbi:hypothetical protein EDD17DRAFT_1877507 [Pisolithus thermaeus]|nr:hypothetical protein EDD17DRAFT_1877507 [Pisolithus thermaeus]